MHKHTTNYKDVKLNVATCRQRRISCRPMTYKILPQHRRSNGSTLLKIIIWPTPWAGKMNQIMRCDWLLERARWSYLARSGLPAVSRKQNFPKGHIINPLFIHLLEGRVTVSNNFPKRRQNGFKIGTRDKFRIHLRKENVISNEIVIYTTFFYDR